MRKVVKFMMRKVCIIFMALLMMVTNVQAIEFTKCDEKVKEWYEGTEESSISVFVFFKSVDEKLALRLDELGYNQKVYEEQFDEVIKPMIENGTYIYPGQSEAYKTTTDEVLKKYNEVKNNEQKALVDEMVLKYLNDINKSDKKYSTLYTQPSIVVTISKDELDLFMNHELVKEIAYYGKNTTNDKVYDATYFCDLNKNEWYYNVVDKVIQLKIMGNFVIQEANNYFEPDTYTSRGMVVTILRNLCQENVNGYENKFSDVGNGLWYTQSIAWANANGIVSGYANGLFGADEYVKREDLAVMLYNYAKYKKVEGKNDDSLDGFKDKENVSSYAQKAMEWCISNDIISGSIKADGIYLNPTSYATRAEIAKMIYKMYLLIK